MKPGFLTPSRVRRILRAIARTRVLVIGDVMLDQFIWGCVSRISPEAPVPVIDFQRESFMPGGAANVARNLSALGVPTELFSIVGQDDPAQNLRRLLREQRVGCAGLLAHGERPTSVKTRIVAHRQQVVRVDRESRQELDSRTTGRLLNALEPRLQTAAGVI